MQFEEVESTASFWADTQPPFSYRDYFDDNGRPITFDASHQEAIIVEEPPEEALDEVKLSYENGLPHPDFRVAGYKDRASTEKNKFETPLDERGLVDVDELIRQVKETVVSDYGWPGYCDRHHTFWPRADYEACDEVLPSLMARSFRDLAINKIWVPRSFHNWVHAVTIPPPMPSFEVMRESINEWVVIRDFFASVKETTAVMRIYDRERQRRTFTPEQVQILDDDMRRRLGGVIMNVQRLEKVEVSRWSFSLTMGVHSAAGQVGDLVIRGWQRRTKDVHRPRIDLAEVA